MSWDARPGEVHGEGDAAGIQSEMAKCFEEYAASAVATAAAAQGTEAKAEHEIKSGMSGRDSAFATFLSKAVAQGDVDPRSKVAQRMDRELTADQKSALKKLTNCEKKAFRLDWATKKLPQFMEEKTFKHEWRKIDITKGSYVSASRVFQLEGGTDGDAVATEKIIDKCAAMGPPFVLYNEFSERYDFLYLSKEFAEEMSRSWGLFQKWSSTPRSDPAATKEALAAGLATPSATLPTGALSEGIATPQVALPAAAATPKPQGKGLKRKFDADGNEILTPKKEVDPETKKGQKTLCDALKVKSKFFKVMKAAETVLDAVQHDQLWQWAKSEHTTKALHSTYAQVSGCQTDFVKLFHAHELVDVKKQMTSGQLIKDCQHYVDSFDKRLDELSKETVKLNKMHLIVLSH
jgi:hypothetical protein